MKNKFNYAEATVADFESAVGQYGWVVYENALSEELVDGIINDFTGAYDTRRQIQIENGIDTSMEGTLHHVLERDNFGLYFLEQMFCDKEMRHFLDGKYILNGMSGVINMKNDRPYVQNVHRDLRTFTGNLKMMIQMIVLLDDFTLDNGATYLLSGSHKEDVKPDDEYFYKHADRAIAKRGSIILFDSNLWHAAGKNYTENPRRVITLSFTKPFFKPQFDFPRFLGYEFGKTLSENLRQVVGYNARIPANLYEFYQPVHLRMYQPGQG
ncbi:phytanoyl-CoA dioxygenase [Pedobacter hiemivivus]|uniref:Phytanoyl-CoA dioxygenase n=1 Tax=Pedobacter hiemivivus TaxID=2530454 RepID=A0A4U1FYN5_9SPHI|nr:phytanoyl-CoA dioxygenase family protein [Pedobacter hiemivivus]TKC56225.1 phytanoyl-CoA dioxygenase [Pedobacter hiemivivus]